MTPRLSSSDTALKTENMYWLKASLGFSEEEILALEDFAVSKGLFYILPIIIGSNLTL